ncbi:hypothetical protein [Hyalangium sp.]|uniref:M61 family metallopeptidase n=1 Tax=Hyalangium sp. TaxID=2028555 RepID=UPI002D230005|nr:hypothetical protein [Hyalangium sp.]HYH94453.1 hypothetical protein [Hyalangium sp.]
MGLALVACATVRPSAPEPSEGLRLKYRVTVSSTEVRVLLEVHGRAGQRVPFQVAGSHGAGRDFRIVSEIASQDGDGASLALSAPGPHRWETQAPPDGRLRLSYRVRTDPEAHGLSHGQPGSGEMPKLDERHVFLLGALVFVVPAESSAVQGPIPVEWEVPPGWQILTPFGHEAPDLTTLLANYLAAGKFSRATLDVPGGLQLEVAWFGDEDVARSTLPELLSRVFGATLELMGSRAPTMRYVIMLRPDFPPGTVQGSPKEGSIQVHLPRDLPLERVHAFRSPGDPVLARILAHEYLHTWGRERAEGLYDSTGPEAGGELRWFEEGFVHYLSQLVLLRAGLMDSTAFLSAVDRAHASVQQNPWYGKASLAEASERFFEDAKARELSYNGGMVVAFLCDMELRARGHGSLERFLDLVPPGRQVQGLARWLESWEKKTGSTEPVASWVRTAAPLPFLDARTRATESGTLRQLSSTSRRP